MSKSAHVQQQLSAQAAPQIHASDYVVPSLEAALWAFYYSQFYEECLLKADTLGAIAGQLTVSFYGLQGIPQIGLNRLP